MRIQPINDAAFGASVSDFDCAAPESAAIDELRTSLHRHQVLVFPDQEHLTPQQEVGFYRSIDTKSNSVWRDQVNNPWEVYKVAQGNRAGTYQIPAEPGVLVLGKGEIDHHGLRVTLGGERDAYGKDQGSQVLGGGALQWHIDGTFYGHSPCRYTQMRCIEAPAGNGHWLAYDDGGEDRLWCEAGSTAFASGRLAFDLLPAAARQQCLNTRVHYCSNPFQSTYAFGNSNNGLRVVDPEAEQSYRQGKDIAGAVIDDPLAQVYPLVWTCPVTGRQALMPHPRCLHALEQRGEGGSHFLGVTESRFLVEAWMRPAIVPALVYVHAWRSGDLVLWDNRSLWHSATGKLSRDDRRVMHLTAFNGDEPPR
ncbi:MAG: TauD/TfdA family dioxygenase [Gammaproteobacteria bacterium]|nr:TauD/TfdA family dioxygenase [Gammaproteobacteria bacterium]MDH3537720.1 TauD/TfdA family dioxygenase [Gammaproteobacteria bacterium]